MTLVPKREYVFLLLGDVAVFVASLWLALALRYLEFPSEAFFILHLVPFSFLFVAWLGVFFLAGLYSRHSRIFKPDIDSNLSRELQFSFGIRQRP